MPSIFQKLISIPQLLFEDVGAKDCPKHIEFMDIPFISMDKTKINCTHGADRNRSIKKKRLNERIEKACV